MNCKKLYLDDVRETPPGFDRVHTYKEFVDYIETNGLPDFISFDHDLGEEDSGLDCAKYVINYCNERGLPAPEFAVHSMNPVGADNIKGYFDCYNRYYSRVSNNSSL